MNDTQTSLHRRILASAAALGGAAVLGLWDHSPPLSLFFPIGLLLMSALFAHFRHLGLQMVMRAVWWCNLLLGTLIATCSSPSEGPMGALLALTTGAALLFMGRGGLMGPSAGAFAPQAFRKTLLCMLVMAMADAQSLFFFGLLQLEGQHGAKHFYVPMGCGLLVTVAIFGLYRLRIWGVLLNLCANLAIAGLAFSGAFDFPRPLLIALCATAGIQVLLAAPIVVALFRGARKSSATIPLHGYLATSLLIGTMMLLSVLTAYVLHIRLLSLY